MFLLLMIINIVPCSNNTTSDKYIISCVGAGVPVAVVNHVQNPIQIHDNKSRLQFQFNGRYRIVQHIHLFLLELHILLLVYSIYSIDVSLLIASTRSLNSLVSFAILNEISKSSLQPIESLRVCCFSNPTSMQRSSLRLVMGCSAHHFPCGKNLKKILDLRLILPCRVPHFHQCHNFIPLKDYNTLCLVIHICCCRC